jgi:hypothetical protein
MGQAARSASAQNQGLLRIRAYRRDEAQRKWKEKAHDER